MQMYQWNAIDYAKSSSVQQQWARELIRKLDLKGNETILDIGCGDGKVTAEIASYVPNGSVLGIDSSNAMVALAQSTYPAETFINLHFQQEDASSLPFHDEFDIVFSNATLHWILDHRPVLKGISASLKHGGRILLQMGGRGNAEEVKYVFDILIATNEWRSCFDGFCFTYGFYGIDEYQIWLHEAGLHANRVELIPKVAAHHGRTGLEAWIRTTWLPHTQRVPEEKRQIFIAQWADAYLKQHPLDKNGVVNVNMVRLEVEAMKL